MKAVDKLEAGESSPAGKWQELLDEFRAMVLQQNSFLDAILPPIVTLLLNSLFGLQVAIWSAFGLSVLLAGFRLSQKQSLRYALAGVGSVVLAIVLVWWLGRTEGFFVPSLVTGSLTTLLALLSLLIRKPMVAWTSHLARRWPLEWYWHPQVRPAYSEVTLVWMFFFGLSFFWQVALFQGRNLDQLTLVNTLTGWSSTIVLLVLSYLWHLAPRAVGWPKRG